MLAASIPAAFLAASTADRLVRRLFDNTFAGIHQLGWFDLSLLIPYFGILIILSVYGLHRYDIIRMYFKYRKELCPSNNTTSNSSSSRQMVGAIVRSPP